MKIIAFISQKGGVGKSTLAQSLVISAQHAGYSVFLADCDAQQQTSYDWARLRQKNKLTPIESRVFNTVEECLNSVHQYKYDLLVIDGPARISVGTLKLALKADLLVQPTSSSAFDLFPVLREYKSLRERGISREKLLVVANRILGPNDYEIIYNSCANAGFDCLSAFLPERSSYKQNSSEGLSLVENVFTSLRNKAQELNNIILSKVGLDKKISK